MEKAPKTRIRAGDIAFWNYNLFPYLLSGKIEKTSNSTNFVLIENYGFWWWKSDLSFVLPPTAGRNLQTLLAALKDEHWQAERNLEEKFYSRLIRYLREAGVKAVPSNGRPPGKNSRFLVPKSENPPKITKKL
jgi:hypothetical protein